MTPVLRCDKTPKRNMFCGRCETITTHQMNKRETRARCGDCGQRRTRIEIDVAAQERAQCKLWLAHGGTIEWKAETGLTVVNPFGTMME